MSLPRQRARNGVLSADVAARQPCPTANHEPQIMDEVAKQFGFQYSVRTADIDEKAIRHDDPHKLVLALARAKCDAILARMDASERATAGDGRGPFLLTCDQVVVYQGRILEKPEDQEECRSFIRCASTHPESEGMSRLECRGSHSQKVGLETLRLYSCWCSLSPWWQVCRLKCERCWHMLPLRWRAWESADPCLCAGAVSYTHLRAHETLMNL
eukprot:366578-Chlamydomonas_euryale.AAC.1